MLRGFVPTIALSLLVLARGAQAADASALFAEGERAFAAGEFREAVRLFEAARESGSTGPSSYYNIGVSYYRLRDYGAAEAAFAALAAEFPAMRELAEYNRGLALRAAGRVGEARSAFARASASTDDKIAALANAQLVELGRPESSGTVRWRGYFSGGFGYDDNVALVDELVLTTEQSSASPLVELLGVGTRAFGAGAWRIDASGYAVRYADAEQFDQSALRVALMTDRRIGDWTLAVGPTLARSTLDGDGFEKLIGADLRLRRGIGERLTFETRLVYDDAGAGDARFAYLDGARRQLRFALQRTGGGRLRIGYDFERNDRADPGVSPSRQRWSLSYAKRLRNAWTADASVAHRDSRYPDATVPRDERLVEVSFAARRGLRNGWGLDAAYRWSDNDSSVPAFSYESQRVSLSLSRSL